METFLAIHHNHYDRLLSAQATDQEVFKLLAPVGFADPRAAHHSLLRLAGDARIRPALVDLLPHLLAALAEAAKAAPRDDAGRTRRGLELYASRDVGCGRLRAFLRTALGGDARFATARLVLSRDDALVFAEAVPKGKGEVGEFLESGSEVLLEKIAASIPGKFGVVPAR